LILEGKAKIFYVHMAGNITKLKVSFHHHGLSFQAFLQMRHVPASLK
jgi:hypothetical protein